jgi:hypothetical protein
MTTGSNYQYSRKVFSPENSIRYRVGTERETGSFDWYNYLVELELSRRMLNQVLCREYFQTRRLSTGLRLAA